jgi:hypothetical protein
MSAKARPDFDPKIFLSTIGDGRQIVLATTNLIESPQSGVRMRTRRVCRWRDTAMVARWAAASFLATEKNFRRIMGWKDLWQLEAIFRKKNDRNCCVPAGGRVT